MTKSKNTKRALLASVLSMFLCVAMLIGSTFAWFTDSVTNGKNKIVAGNLDIELYHTNGNVTEEEQVEADTPLFVNADGTDILWEPGVMVYENFTVKNVGSLALKYLLNINAVKFNTVKGTDQSLKDVLKVAILDEAFSGDRDAAKELTFDKTIADFAKSGNLVPLKSATETAKAEETYAIVIYWEPSAVDNDYNLNNGKTSSDGGELFIDLGVDLFATQDTVENDSFDNQYDADALKEVATAEDLTGAIKPGANILLSDNIALADALVIDQDGVTINLNGKELTLGAAMQVTGENVTIKNGSIKRPDGTTYSAEGSTYAYGLELNGVNTTIANVMIDSGINVSGYDADNAVKPGVSAKIENCSITLDYAEAAYAICARGEASVDVKNVVITKNQEGTANYYFFVEGDTEQASASSMTTYNMEYNSTCGTAESDPSGVEPEDWIPDENDFEDPFGD